jgi:hypothetical protein
MGVWNYTRRSDDTDARWKVLRVDTYCGGRPGGQYLNAGFRYSFSGERAGTSPGLGARPLAYPQLLVLPYLQVETNNY